MRATKHADFETAKKIYEAAINNLDFQNRSNIYRSNIYGNLGLHLNSSEDDKNLYSIENYLAKATEILDNDSAKHTSEPHYREYAKQLEQTKERIEQFKQFHMTLLDNYEKTRLTINENHSSAKKLDALKVDIDDIANHIEKKENTPLFDLIICFSELASINASFSTSSFEIKTKICEAFKLPHDLKLLDKSNIGESKFTSTALQIMKQLPAPTVKTSIKNTKDLGLLCLEAMNFFNSGELASAKICREACMKHSDFQNSGELEQEVRSKIYTQEALTLLVEKNWNLYLITHYFQESLQNTPSSSSNYSAQKRCIDKYKEILEMFKNLHDLLRANYDCTIKLLDPRISLEENTQLELNELKKNIDIITSCIDKQKDSPISDYTRSTKSDH